MPKEPIARGKNLLTLLQSIYYSQNSEKNRDCMEPRKTKGIKKITIFSLVIELKYIYLTYFPCKSHLSQNYL